MTLDPILLERIKSSSGLLGFAFGAINFWLLTRIVTGLIHSETTSRLKIVFYFFGKMTFLFGTIGLILWKVHVSPLPFLGGFTLSLVLGITVALIKGRQIHA